MSLAGCQIISIFTAKNVWKFLIKIQLTKSNPKIIRELNPPCLMPIKVKAFYMFSHNIHKVHTICMLRPPQNTKCQVWVADFAFLGNQKFEKKNQNLFHPIVHLLKNGFDVKIVSSLFCKFLITVHWTLNFANVFSTFNFIETAGYKIVLRHNRINFPNIVCST